MNLIERITDLILSDDENTDKQSDILTRTYDDANAEKKTAIDNALICICGYSLKTLLNGY